MRRLLRMSTLGSLLLSFAVPMMAALIAGCDSGPNLNDPEVKKQVADRREAIQKEDEKNTALLKKQRGGKNAPVLKSIKGGIKAQE